MADMSGNAAYTLNLLPMWQAHHTKASGYGRIVEHLDGRVIDRVSNWTYAKRAIGRAFRPMYDRSGSKWYHRNSFVTELEAARYWFGGRGQLFHFLYGEQCFRYFGYLKLLGSRNAIVCTYHTPPEKFREMVQNTAHMRFIDALIVLSRMQVPFFSDIVGHDRVYYVPRSVDTDYFVPAPGVRTDDGLFHCLFVGSFLRDFATLASAARMLSEKTDDIRFTVITQPKYNGFFDGIRTVTVLNGISDEQLLRQYQGADALVLTLLDATANNVIVEAMACGLPIVSNDMPGVRDYVTDDCASLVPRQDPRGIAEAVLRLYADRARRQRMAEAGRSRALDFNIAETARKTREVYDAVMAGFAG
jgi:glycosyltransferase involved in cell wall biosynthesis